MIKVLINNFDYLISIVGDNFNNLAMDSKPNIQNIWGFWSKYSSSSSISYPYIMKFITSNIETINNPDIINFLNRYAPHSRLLKNISLRVINLKDNQNKILAGQILGKHFNNDVNVYNKVCKIDERNPNVGKIVALCIGWPDSPKLKTFFEQIKDSNFRINHYAAFQLKFIFRDIDNILDFFNKVLTNPNEAKYLHNKFITPMIKRISIDINMQKVIKEKLLISNSPSIKVSFYAILSSIGKIDQDVLEWKKKQIINKVSNAYGFNIVTNEYIPFTDILYKEIY